MSQVTHTVVRGDTLSAVAKKYDTTVDSLAALNDLSIKSNLYIGQTLYIRNKTITPNMTSARAANMYTVDITGMGLQSNSDNTIFITWSFKTPNTDHYVIEWGYSTADGRWYNGGNDTCQNDIYGNIPKESTYSLPSNGVSARARVKPVSKTYKDKKGNEVSYWQGQWTAWHTYSSKNNPPNIPPTPNVEIDKYTMKLTIDNLNVNELRADEIEFQIVQNDNWVFNTGTSKILMGRASYSVQITPSFTYKARARSKKGSNYSGWSDFTGSNESLPSAPTGINSLEAISDTAVKLTWTKIASAKTYSIEYAEKDIYFEGSNGTTVIDGIETTTYVVTGLTKGTKYHFRIKCVNDSGSSGWSPSSSITIGTKPEPPSTWSDRTIAIVGEKVLLSWLHNTVDGSEQKESEIEFTVNGVTDTHKIGMDVNQKPINTFEMPTFMHTDGTKVYWRVRTRGIMPEFSDWSIQRVIDIYAPPTLSANILNDKGNATNTINNFPFTVTSVAGPPSQTPIMYYISVKAKDAYITSTPFGDKYINVDEEIFGEVLNSKEQLSKVFTASNIDLENGINYQVDLKVTMDSGLSAEANVRFDVSWVDVKSSPNAEILLDKDRLSASLRPYCERYTDLYKVVEKQGSRYIETDKELTGEFQNATSIDKAVTFNTKKQVYADNLNRLFCIYEGSKVQEVTNVTLSVYKRTYDGEFIEIATGLRGDNNTFVTDPHPSLDFARYRIVSMDDATGAVSYTDIASKSFDEESIIVQWDEGWSDFLTDGESMEDKLYTSGSLLRLPFNINISESNKPDVSTISYIGREHPVSYYGTALGVSSSVSAEFDKNDDEMLYQVRRLSTYMGDVYVRMPSGIGYWANVNVSYNRNYDSLVIPVTFNIVRVSGGI